MQKKIVKNNIKNIRFCIKPMIYEDTKMKHEFNDLSEGCAKMICPWCSTPVMKSQKGRPRTFCSDKCRWAFDKYRIRKRKKEMKFNEDSNTQSY